MARSHLHLRQQHVACGACCNVNCQCPHCGVGVGEGCRYINNAPMGPVPSNAVLPPVSSPLESINRDGLPAQVHELIEAGGGIDPSLEEIQETLEVIDLPADVKRYLYEVAALAEQVRKWERETKTFVRFLAETADSALTPEHLETVLGESGVVQINKESTSVDAVSSS